MACSWREAQLWGQALALGAGSPSHCPNMSWAAAVHEAQKARPGPETQTRQAAHAIWCHRHRVGGPQLCLHSWGQGHAIFSTHHHPLGPPVYLVDQG